VKEVRDYITELGKKDSPLFLKFNSKIEEVQKWSMKRNLHPETDNLEITKLKEEILSMEVGNGEKSDEQCKKLATLASIRESLKPQEQIYNKVFGKLENLLSSILNSISLAGGYSNRGRRAHLMNPNAGITKIEGAKTDKHGNACGSEYDLGVDDAFNDFTIMDYYV
jgi:hypothetical protein